MANAMPGMPTKELGPPDFLIVGQPHCKNLNLALKGQCPVFIFSCRVTKCHKLRGLNKHPFSSQSVVRSPARHGWILCSDSQTTEIKALCSLLEALGRIPFQAHSN